MSRHLSQSWLMYHVQNISRLLATPTADKAILHLVLSPFLCRFSMGTWRFAPTVPTPTGSALQKRPPTRRRITWLGISRIDIVWKGFSSNHHLPQSALDQLADSRECSEHGGFLHCVGISGFSWTLRRRYLSAPLLLYLSPINFNKRHSWFPKDFLLVLLSNGTRGFRIWHHDIQVLPPS